jgi:hypothetical protein
VSLVLLQLLDPVHKQRVFAVLVVEVGHLGHRHAQFGSNLLEGHPFAVWFLQGTVVVLEYHLYPLDHIAGYYGPTLAFY